MKDIKELLVKEKESIKAQKIRKSTKIKEKGITLIALVVTIIILLILTGVTLNMALSDNGLFKKAKEAVEKYEKAQEDEEEAIRQIATEMYNEYVGAKVTGYIPTSNEEGCTIGTTTSGVNAQDTGTSGIEGAVIDEDGNQTFKTEGKMQWRVWDFDGNILRIIGDPTEQALALKGAAGYNNGVWAIDHICEELYSNNKPGVTVTSLKRTDIQKISSYDYTQYKHAKDNWVEVTGNSDTEGLKYFGESISNYTNENKKYPKMWNDNDADWTYGYDNETKSKTGSDQECKVWEEVGKGKGLMDGNMTTGSDSTTFKQSYYYHNYSRNEFPNQKYYDLIFKKADGQSFAGRYWLAGRSVRLYESRCLFGMQGVKADSSGSLVDGDALCDSNGTVNVRKRTVRTMVTIDLQLSGCNMKTITGQDGNVESCNLSFES